MNVNLKKQVLCLLIIAGLYQNSMANYTSFYPDSIVRIVNIEANGMIFTCRIAGDNATGKPVMLLHGWPETSHMWIELMKKLSA